MNTALRLLPALSFLVAVGCYGDKVFVEDGAGGDTPTSTSTSGGAPPTGGNGNAGAAGGQAPGGQAPGGGGGEGPTGCTNPGECPTASDCVEATCEGMTCGEENKPAGESCTNGFQCDGAGACVECLSNTDCTPPDTCDLGMNECVPPQCSNGSLDAGETDIDCGGTVCTACENADSCLVASDCVSGFCGPGAICAPCSTDGQCGATNYCLFNSCVPRLPNGSACNGNNQCLTDACVQTGIGGICCNSGCTGSCMSCAIGDTGLATGTCGNTLANLDPENECPTQSCRTGSCGGNGSCGISPVNTACDDALFCNGTDSCNATGACSNHSGNPCAEATPDANCQDDCSELANACTLNSVSGSPCNDSLFCNGSPDMCNGSGSCVPSSNPCPGQNTPFNCNDSCNETSNNCSANDVAGTQCNHDGDGTIGACTTTGNCQND